MEIIDSVYFFEKMLHSDMETTGDLQSPKIQSQNPNLTQCKVEITFICWFYFLQKGQHMLCKERWKKQKLFGCTENLEEVKSYIFQAPVHFLSMNL